VKLSNQWNNSNIPRVFPFPLGRVHWLEWRLHYNCHFGHATLSYGSVVLVYQENECRYRCNIVEEGNYCQSNVSFVDLFSMSKFFIP